MTDIAAIAAGLSKAQRELLLALDPVEYRDWTALSVNVRTRNKLATLGLAHFDDSGPVRCYFMRRLSPLGLAVRAILEAQNDRPTFETREAYLEWEKEQADYGMRMLFDPTFSIADMDSLRNEIIRVRAAHAHLLEKNDG